MQCQPVLGVCIPLWAHGGGERQQAGLHIESTSLGLDWGHFPTFIFLEAFSPVRWPVPSLEIVADGCRYLCLQCVRLRGPATVPVGKILQGVAEHQPGEEGGESLGTVLPFEWSGRQILPLSYLFWFGTWTDTVWGFIITAVKKQCGI